MFVKYLSNTCASPACSEEEYTAAAGTQVSLRLSHDDGGGDDRGVDDVLPYRQTLLLYLLLPILCIVLFLPLFHPF